MPPSPNYRLQAPIYSKTPATGCHLFICPLSPCCPPVLSCRSGGRSHSSSSYLPRFALLCIPASAFSRKSLDGPRFPQPTLTIYWSSACFSCRAAWLLVVNHSLQVPMLLALWKRVIESVNASKKSQRRPEANEVTQTSATCIFST